MIVLRDANALRDGQKVPILQQGLMDWIVTGIIAAIGVALAAHRSSYLVDYALIVYVFNRGLRRLLDYYAGTFNPLSPVSLTPLLVTALMIVPFLVSYNTLTKPLKVIFGCLFVAITCAFFVGFARIQFAAVYAAAEALAPIAMFGYIVTSSPSAATKDRWLRTSAWCAVVACAYGWYQYVTIPPWDAFWVRAVGMEGYLGILEPFKISVFSTMAERGVFGGFLGFAVVPMIIAPKWRPLGWFGVILVLSCILLAGTRTGIILADFYDDDLCSDQRGNGRVAACRRHGSDFRRSLFRSWRNARWSGNSRTFFNTRGHAKHWVLCKAEWRFIRARSVPF